MPGPLSTVVLEHETSDGATHFDWLLDPGKSTQSALLTFRVPENPAQVAIGRLIEAVRLPDHRRIYLEYEGPISGARGQVRRIDQGQWGIPPGNSIVAGDSFEVTWERGEQTQFWRLDTDSGMLIRVESTT